MRTVLHVNLKVVVMPTAIHAGVYGVGEQLEVIGAAHCGDAFLAQGSNVAPMDRTHNKREGRALGADD